MAARSRAAKAEALTAAAAQRASCTEAGIGSEGATTEPYYDDSYDYYYSYVVIVILVIIILMIIVIIVPSQTDFNRL